MQAAARRNVGVGATSHSCTRDVEGSRLTCRVVIIASHCQTVAGAGKRQAGREMRVRDEEHCCAAVAAARTGHCYLRLSACERPMDSCYTTSECRHP
jgi:hypothetical protein